MGEDGTQDPLDQHMLVIVELQTFPKYLRPLPVFSRVRVARSLVFCASDL
jgi:hypothetical protein